MDSVAVKNTPSGSTRRVRVKVNQIPDEIMRNETLNQAISKLPANYNFEIHKTIWRILQEKPKITTLQFPEGLLMYSCIIADIISRFCQTKVVIMGDVTYGACCVDDFTTLKLGSTFLVHYGHSCLVPVNSIGVKVLYVFIEISFDTSHLIETIRRTFPTSEKIALMGTVQFSGAIQQVSKVLKESFPNVYIAQAKPLSQGETLGNALQSGILRRNQ